MKGSIGLALLLGAVALALAGCETAKSGSDSAVGTDVPADVPTDAPLSDAPKADVPVGQDASDVPSGNDVPIADAPTSPDTPVVCASGHTEVVGGVCHKTGKEDPLANCTSCHGAKLDGGPANVSCYSCHSAADHTIDRGGKMHREGTSASCNPCHGPNNSGGLGPACTSCHANPP